jgi:hypothetical protein
MAVKLADIPAIVNMVNPNRKSVGELRITMSFRIMEHYNKGRTASIPYNASGSILLSILWGADKTAKRIAYIHDLDYGVVNQGEPSHPLRHTRPKFLERLEVVELERWFWNIEEAKKESPSQKEIAEKKAMIKADFLANFPYDVKDKPYPLGNHELLSHLEVELTLEEALKLFNDNKLTVSVYDETLNWANGKKEGLFVFDDGSMDFSWTFERDVYP